MLDADLENSMDKISIIVPVYKVEKYLDRCIESLIKQTYKNIEIILVDDGSPDCCPEICDAYAEQYPQIHVVHKKNGGLSEARNYGVVHSTGKYIGFVDGDDFVKPDMYEKLYYALKKGKTEMAVCGFEQVDTNGKSLKNDENSPIKTGILSQKEFMHKMSEPSGWYYVVAWNKLYSRKLVELVKFPVGKVHEDEYTAHLFAGYCENIMVIEEQYYCYVRNPEGITGATYRVERLMGMEAILERAIYFMEHGYENLLPATEAAVNYGFCMAFSKLNWKENKKEINKYLKKYRAVFPKIIKYCDLGKKSKFKRYCMMYFPGIYQIVFKE